MSDIATAVKTDEKTQRAEAPRVLKLGSFRETGVQYWTHTATMPTGWDFEDAMKPGFWTNVVHLIRGNKLTSDANKTGSIVELRTEDHAFFALLYIRAAMESGLIVQCIGPVSDPKSGKACPVDLETGLPWQGRSKPFR